MKIPQFVYGLSSWVGLATINIGRIGCAVDNARLFPGSPHGAVI